MLPEDANSGRPRITTGACASLLAVLAVIALISCEAPGDAQPEGEGGYDLSPEAAGFSPTIATLADRATARIVEEVRPREISEALKVIAARPHPAGSAADHATAEAVHRRFLAAGLQSRIDTYEVLLPFPEEVTIELLLPTAYGVRLHEEPSDSDFDTHSRTAIAPYLAWSPDGEVTAPLVYVNLARPEDFRHLRDLGVAIEGAVGIARLGAEAPGSQVRRAADAGLAGLLLYADPGDDGYRRGDVYPRGPWRPASAVRRASVLDLAAAPGDPLTPGIAALPNAKRIDVARATAVPPIVAAPLSPEEARPLLESLPGAAVPPSWQGGHPFTYHVGGKGSLVHVRTTSQWHIRKVWNVIATLPGFPCGDEQIMVGAHRDAWVHGACAAGSGTAVLLESARVLGRLARSGLRPSRSIVFCSWDAASFGAIGSVEHVEAHRDALRGAAVLYIDCDAEVAGEALQLAISPELAAWLPGALAAVPAEPGSSPTLLDVTPLPAPEPPTGSEDLLPFRDHLGMPVLQLRAPGAFGVAGSLYDTYGWMKRFGDPDFTRHARVCRLVSALAFRASLATILPHDHRPLLDWIDTNLRDLAAAHPTFDPAALLTTLEEISEEVRVLDELRRAVLDRDPEPARLRGINKNIQGLGLVLCADDLLPGRPFYRSLLAAPEAQDLNTLVPLPDLTAALISEDPDLVVAATARLTRALGTLKARITFIADTLRALAERL